MMDTSKASRATSPLPHGFMKPGQTGQGHILPRELSSALGFKVPGIPALLFGLALIVPVVAGDDRRYRLTRTAVGGHRAGRPVDKVMALRVAWR